LKFCTPFVSPPFQPEAQLGENVVVINSTLKGEVTVGDKSIVCHSCLSGNIHIGKDSLVSGLSIEHMKVHDNWFL
jgi:bifunctional N-acetylglucosamine-1-phosphate-uridyltransferase/glucosamine-1-phosphate-acetyltransferase GlmU-like protein